jgi:hypothetical protein
MTTLKSMIAANTPTQKTPLVTPCPICGSAVLWIDPYGNAHCPGCDPPAAVAMIRRKVVVQHGTGPGGTDRLVDLEEVRRGQGNGQGNGAAETRPEAHAVGPPPGVGYDEWFDSRASGSP